MCVMFMMFLILICLSAASIFVLVFLLFEVRYAPTLGTINECHLEEMEAQEDPLLVPQEPG